LLKTEISTHVLVTTTLPSAGQEAYPPLPWLLESKGKLVIHSLGQFGNLAGPGRPIHEARFKGV